MSDQAGTPPPRESFEGVPFHQNQYDRAPRQQRDAFVLTQLRRLPTIAALIAEIEYTYDHHHNPAALRRTPEEIQAALDRAYRPFWRRWLNR